jgi:hypothetical protein
MRSLIYIFFFLVASSLFAQEQPLLVMGTISSSHDSSAVEGVVVSCKDPARHAVSNSKGRYAIFLERKSGMIIEFHALGYRTQIVKITGEMLTKFPGDTMRLDVVLIQELIELRPFTVTSGPDTVFGNWKFFVEDYMFTDDGKLVLLTFEKSLKESKIVLADQEQKILSSFDIPVEAKELYRDYQGFINVLCVDSAFRVKILPPSQILLLALPYRDFCDRMFPCVDTLGGRILFSNYSPQYPAFSYFAYNPADTSVQNIHYVVDQQLLDSYNWEFDFLKPKDRLYARKMESYTGIDKRIIAATMTGFPNSIYYTPLYAPMFVKNDTICVFDHYRDTLFLYDKNMQCIGANRIDYHHPKNWKDWDRQLYQDEITGEIYAQFEKDGIYTLKKIDIRTGKVVGSYKIENPWVKHIRIRNGDVFYIYRPKDSIQSKFLYKEKLSMS